MIDVVTVGAAVQDVFLSGKIFTPQREEDGKMVEEFLLGSKNDVEGITFSTGGGATNAAVTFARNGLNASFMGQIGEDPAGHAVLNDLEKEGVAIDRVVHSDHATGYSVLLLAPSGERTILTYRGASTHYNVENFSLEAIDTKWLYISTLAGNMDLLEKLVDQASEKGIKIAANPGKKELAEAERLKKLLPKIDILSLNKEETARLVDADSHVDLVKGMLEFVAVFALTDGPNGSWVGSKEGVVKAGMYEDCPVIDRTGAGDAFASGFTAATIQGKDLKSAVTFASANSTEVVQKIGAKAGIISQDYELHDMPIEELNG